MFLHLAKLVTSRHFIIYVAEVVDQCIKFVVKTVVSIMGKTVAKIVVIAFVLQYKTWCSCFINASNKSLIKRQKNLILKLKF